MLVPNDIPSYWQSGGREMGTIGRVDEICINATCDCCQCHRQQIIPQTFYHYFPYFCCEHYGHRLSDPNYSSACPFKLPTPSLSPSPSPSPSPPLQPSLPPSPSTSPTATPQNKRPKFSGTKGQQPKPTFIIQKLGQQNLKFKLDVAIPVGRNPSWNSPKLYFLAIQHALVIIWNTMMTPFTLVALMGGGNLEKAEAIQSSLFVTAITTVLQIEFGSRLPVVMQRSQAFIIPAISVAVSANTNCSITLNHRQRFKLSVRRVQGASIIASLFQMIGGFSGARKLLARKSGSCLSPLASAPFVTLTGLGLYLRGYPQLFKCIEIGGPTLVLLFFSTQFLPQLWKSKRKKWLVQHFAAVTSAVVVWLFVEILTAVGAYNNVARGSQNSCSKDRFKHISYTPWIKISPPFQWGAPIFDISDFLLMIAAAFVASVESTGTFVATSRSGGADFIRSSNYALDRAIGFQGIGTFLEAIFGMGHGSTASVEHAGLVGLTEVGSRRVVLLSAVFLLTLSILAKFGAFLAAIPSPIVAALQILFFPYVATAGIDYLQFCNTNTNRSKFIFGASIFAGVSLPQHFKGYSLVSDEVSTAFFTPSTRFQDIIQVVFSSPPTVAAITALICDQILHSEKILKKILHKLSFDQEDDESSSEEEDEDDESSSEEDDGSSDDEDGLFEKGIQWITNLQVVSAASAPIHNPRELELNKEKAKKPENVKDGMQKIKKAPKVETAKKIKLKTKAAEDGTLMFDALLKLEKSRDARARAKMKGTRAKKDDARMGEKIIPPQPPAPRSMSRRTKDIKAPGRKTYSVPVKPKDYLS